MDYEVIVDGKEIVVPFSTFVSWNNESAQRYHEEQDPTRKREIAAFLFALDLPLFQPWDIFDQSERSTYEQEAFFYLVRALQKFQPGRGAFVHFLKRFYVSKAREAHFGAARGHQELRAATGEAVDPAPDPRDRRDIAHGRQTKQESRIAAMREAALDQDYGEDKGLDGQVLDPLVDRRLKRLLTPEQYRVFDLRVNQGLPTETVADRCGLSKATALKRLQEALNAAAIETAKGQSQNAPSLPDGSRWLSRHHFGRIFGLTPDYLKVILNPKLTPKHSPYHIDPRDIIPLQGGRIRYLERPEGLSYPRLVRRTPKIAASP